MTPESTRMCRIGRSWDFRWLAPIVVTLRSTYQIRETNKTDKRGNALKGTLQHPWKRDYLQVVNRLVANAIAQNHAIHCARAPTKTLLCITFDAVYGAPIPVAFERSSMVLIHLTTHTIRTNNGTPKQHRQNHDKFGLPYRITAVKL